MHQNAWQVVSMHQYLNLVYLIRKGNDRVEKELWRQNNLLQLQTLRWFQDLARAHHRQEYH